MEFTKMVEGHTGLELIWGSLWTHHFFETIVSLNFLINTYWDPLSRKSTESFLPVKNTQNDIVNLILIKKNKI